MLKIFLMINMLSLVKEYANRDVSILSVRVNESEKHLENLILFNRNKNLYFDALTAKIKKKNSVVATGKPLF